MATERIDIVVQERGSRVVKRNLEDLGGSAKKAGGEVDFASRAIASLGAALVVSKLVEYSDQLTAIEGRLKLVTNTTEALNRVQGNLFDLAQKTRQSFAGTAELYAKLAKATEDLALGEKKLLGITETVNQTLIISGSSAAASQAALIQFAQGLSAGALRGEELNSILEQTPRLAQALADGLGRPVGALKQLGEAGELTTERILAALGTQSAKIQAEFGQLSPTIGQAFQVLNNELLRFVGEGAKTSGVAGAIAGSIKLVADNLGLLAAAGLGLAAAKIASVVLGMAQAVSGAAGQSLAYAAAMNAERAAAIGAAQAEVAKTSATVQDTAAKLAQITSVRAVTMAELQRTSALIAGAQAQIAASRAAGAQSFALASLRQAEQTLAAAMATRAALTTELAALGVAQARATAAATAATVAATGATAGLAAATGAASVASRLMTSVLGFLGGPIGAITTVLGLGVTAWLAWGSTSRQEVAQTSGEVRRTTGEIVADLDKQIKKLEERNALGKAFPTLGSAGGEPTERLAELQAKINDFQNGTGEAAKLNEAARQAILRVTVEQYAVLAGKIQQVAGEQKKMDDFGKGNKASEWLKEYATDAEKLQAKLAQARKELGSAFTPELEKRIRDSFADKSGSKANPFADEVKALKERAAMVGLNTELEKVNAEITLGKYGKLAPAQAAELRALAVIADAKRSNIETEREAAQARVRAGQIAATADAAAMKETEQLRAGNQALRDEIESLGLAEQARLALESARISSLITLREEELLNRLNTEGVTAQSQALEEQIALLKQRQELLGKKADKIGSIESDEAKAKMSEAGRKSEQVLAESVANGLMEGFREGNSLADIFLRELKAQFAKTVLTPLVQPIVSAGNSVLTSILGNALGALRGAFGGTPTVPGSIGEVGFGNGPGIGLATGTNYVPYDNFPALLHEGEAVVPKEYNNDKMGKTVSITHAPVYQIDARSDRAAVRQDMVTISQQSNEALVEQLRAAGMLG